MKTTKSDFGSPPHPPLGWPVGGGVGYVLVADFRLFGFAHVLIYDLNLEV